MQIQVTDEFSSNSVNFEGNVLPYGYLPGFSQGWAVVDGVNVYVVLSESREVLVFESEPGAVAPDEFPEFSENPAQAE